MGLGGGGGGSSGRTDFPDYMKRYHQAMLGYTDSAAIGDDFSISIIEAFNAAADGQSPYFAYTTGQLNADDLFFDTLGSKTLQSYNKPFSLLDEFIHLNFDAILSANVASAAAADYVQDLLDAQSTALDHDINTNITPKFHARMRDIGAVMGSAFVIGDAVILQAKEIALAKHRLDVEQLANQKLELASRLTAQKLDFHKMSASLSADFAKYYHAIKAEIDDTNAEFVAKDILWDLKLFQYAANPLGAISGSALQIDSGRGSKTGSAVSGALAGAATGAMIGNVVPGIGTVAGAIGGGVLGLAGGLFS